jgi:hypothetical protein
VQKLSKSDISRLVMLPFKDPDITVNVLRCCDTLRDLRIAIKRKRPGMLTTGVIVLHDNARPHVVCTDQDTLRSMRWKVMDHPPYILDL